MNELPVKPRIKQRIFDLFPTLDLSERKELLERIKIGADGGIDFVVMMLLAATLASLGLLQGATAVVIGAMLVAPLMGPLVAAGLALTQGDLKFFSNSLSVCGIGIVLGLGTSLFFGAINPGFEPSMEIEARGKPDVLDLFIALASGMVAAYAMGRPNVSGTLAGVAIAAALLPPLAVVGIGITNDQFIIAGNAAILFATNLVAIILGAALVFRLLGMDVEAKEIGRLKWVRRATISFALIAVILTAPLLVNVLEKSREGQARPIVYPVSADVSNAVKEYINNNSAINLIAMGRYTVDPDTGISLMVSATGPLLSSVREELVQIVKTARGDANVTVRVFLLQETPMIDVQDD